MAQFVEMPKLSDTMKEGVLRKWTKHEGASIEPGDVIAEVETDKATMDLEAFDTGVILKLLVADGSTVAVGSPLAIIGAAGEDYSDLLSQAGGATAAAPAKAAAPAPAAPAPAAAKPAAAAPVAAAKPAPAPAKAAAPAPTAGRILASPLARRLADELGVDIRSVSGTGPAGRVIERDVKAAAANPPAAAPKAVPANVPPADASLPAPLLPDRRTAPRPAETPVASEDTLIPLTLMRKTIARRLLESKTQIPHFYLTADVNMDAAMAFRVQISEVHGAKLSVNDMILKAVALSLKRNPECNASWTDEGVVRYARVDIGMAVAVEDGLLTPVLRGVDTKTLGQLSQEARTIATKARDRKLKIDEMTGSTFSVSNLGMMGIKDFCAIINPPESGILAVGTVRKEPVVRDDKIVIGHVMSLTLSCDHRVIDGALGAKLLQSIVGILERPMTLAF
jgi:pyruvate dehydrogenase E2 component (dihydrolipoamide acetyltransferase)